MFIITDTIQVRLITDEIFNLRFACPFFVQGPMLFFPSPHLSFSAQVGHSLIWVIVTYLSPKERCTHRDVTIVSFSRRVRYLKSRVLLLWLTAVTNQCFHFSANYNKVQLQARVCSSCFPI